MQIIKRKVSELEGAQLDWAVAIACGYVLQIGVGFIESAWVDGYVFVSGTDKWHPSSNWSQGGPILESMIKTGTWGITPWDGGDSVCVSNTDGECVPYDGDFNKGEINGFGNTVLVAAMRAFVIAKLGYEVEVPA